MRDLDETDLALLRLLAADGRRSYSDLGEAVDLSAPAVSERVSRLSEQGVIRGFTVDVDRSQLREGIAVLLRVDAVPDAVGDLRTTLRDADAVERVYETAGADLVVHAHVPDTDIRSWLFDTVDDDGVVSYEVDLLGGVDRSVGIDATDFALTCAECENTVTSEGTTTRVDGDLKAFCCSSCEAQYLERYEELRAGAE